MDISGMNAEQKISAAVAYLSKNVEKAPESTHESFKKLARLNNEGMQLVSKINEMKQQMAQLDAEIGQKIGGAKVLFEIIGEQLKPEQIDEFAKLFEPKQLNQAGQAQASVDMAGSTASKEAPSQG